MTPAWVLILVACITLAGVLITGVVTNFVSARNNRAIHARWEKDQVALEARWQSDRQAAEDRWHTELMAIESRAARAEEADERQDKRAKAFEIYRLASERAVSEDPRIAQLGVDGLKALLSSGLVGDDMESIVVAALSSSFVAEVRAIEAARQSGEEVVVLQTDLEELTSEDVALLRRSKPDDVEAVLRGGLNE